MTKPPKEADSTKKTPGQSQRVGKPASDMPNDDRLAIPPDFPPDFEAETPDESSESGSSTHVPPRERHIQRPTG